eukprot:GHUV01043791.1.p2 GENE.GHUV01043791.1~~GHUV01043791.1.p2  ORF type:complete len:162 (-),score=36.17 GHUV01043791.1:149-634(-)
MGCQPYRLDCLLVVSCLHTCVLRNFCVASLMNVHVPSCPSSSSFVYCSTEASTCAAAVCAAYRLQVFAAAGLKSAITASIITGGVNLVFTVASASVLDRFGRKPLLLLSYLGMAFALGAVSGVSVMPCESAVSGSATRHVYFATYGPRRHTDVRTHVFSHS